MKKIVFSFFVAAWTVSSAFAVSFDTKEDRIMVWGIRPMGMGGAFTAIADDENAIFYNPAGITQRQSWLLQMLSIDVSVSGETLNTVQDLQKVLNDENSGTDKGISIDGIQRAVDTISGKDISLSISAPNIFFISGPLDFEANSLNFGLGEYSFAEVGARLDFTVPDYIFQLAKTAEKQKLTEEDIFTIMPPDILQKLGVEDLTIDEIVALVAAGDYDEIYDHLNDDARKIVDKLEGGNFDLEEIVDELTAKLDLNQNMEAAGIINVYATGVLDAPIAVRIKELPVPGELSLGVNLKYIYRVKAKKLVSLAADDIGNLENSFDSINVAVLQGNGIGVDLGAIYHFTPQWNFGFQISDAYTKIDYNKVLFKYSKDKEDEDFTHTSTIDPELNVGVAYTPERFYFWPGHYFDTKNRFTFALDIRDLTGNYENSEFQRQLHAGVEYRLWMFALRAGLNKLHPTFGLGIEFSWFQLGYAFYGEDSYLSRAVGKEKTVYYHELLIAFKFGHHDGKPFGSDAKPSQSDPQNTPPQDTAPATPAKNSAIGNPAPAIPAPQLPSLVDQPQPQPNSVPAYDNQQQNFPADSDIDFQEQQQEEVRYF
ncbi:MAG: conjugal transfer protein TraF [Elusimicrobiota bacterium]|jgi:hypothetical protein|nr:conjugal transfer protein TraF [Elusimicrobiota bacterium]